MSIAQLRYFTTVAQLENISRAAELLHISQSALSKHIHKLEEELGMPLFDRNGKKLTLNRQGWCFFTYCNHLLREMDITLSKMWQIAGVPYHRVKIGIAGMSRKVVDCMAAFRRERPNVDFDVDGNIEAKENIDINDFDVLVCPFDGTYDKFTGYPFFKERYCLAVSDQNPLASNATILPRELSGQHFVFLRSDNTNMEFSYSVCVALAVSFGSLCFVDSRELQRQMVAADIAVGFATEDEAPFYESSHVRLIPIGDAHFSRQMKLCFRHEKYMTAMAREFRDFVIQYFSLKPDLDCTPQP